MITQKNMYILRAFYLAKFAAIFLCTGDNMKRIDWDILGMLNSGRKDDAA